MKVIIVLCACLVVALARPQYVNNQPAIERSQDEFGNYHFGFNNGLQAQQESRTANGVVRGSYTYVDANKDIQSFKYTADPFNGFQVRGTNIPGTEGQLAPTETFVGPIMDTPEVIAARNAHLAAVQEVRSTNPSFDGVEIAATPEQFNIGPVTETPEVAAARQAHLQAYEEARLRNGF